MANKSKLDQLTAAVAHAELIPTGRFLTALEIELLDDLAARLRQQFFGDRSEEITDLLRRVSVIRTYKRDAPGGFTALAPATVTPTAPLAPPPAADVLKRKKKSKGVARAQQKARTHTHSLGVAPHSPGRPSDDPVRRPDLGSAHHRAGGNVAHGADGADVVDAGIGHPGISDWQVSNPGPRS